MSPLTLPGTIPGLLRRCSPVTDAGGVTRGLIYAMPGYYRAYPDWWGVNWNYLLQPCDATRLHLDLTDPTGRAHAAWWLNDHDEDTLAQATRAVSGVDDCEAWRWLIVSATSGDAWPDARVEYLRLVCLHVAGLS
jgi:hypothetical protein